MAEMMVAQRVEAPRSACDPVATGRITVGKLELLTTAGAAPPPEREGVDTSGASAWQSGCKFAAALLERVVFLQPAPRVLEVGCGCGVAGIAVAESDASAQVLLTDGHDACLETVALNVGEAHGARCSTKLLKWGDGAAATAVATAFDPTIVLGADVGYDPSMRDILADTLRVCCSAGKRAGEHADLILVEQARFKDVYGFFLEALRKAGFKLIERVDLGDRVYYTRFKLQDIVVV